jgi:Flp pilus assembly protein TadD
MVQPTPGSAALALLTAAISEQARAAILVRAAALLPDSGVPAPRLVELALGTREGPQSLQYHELLGAALVRAGQATAGVRELQEAVRLHPRGGALWTKLFLALAQQRLGNTVEAQHWRENSLQAQTWEEAILQHQLLRELDMARPPGKP